MNPPLLFAFLLTFSAFIFCLWAPPRLNSPDELDRVQVLERIIEFNGGYKLNLLEDFEGNNPWSVYRSNSFLNNLSFVGKTPEGSAFTKEIELYSAIKPTVSQKSLFIHSHFEKGGVSFLEIRPKVPTTLPLGLPVRVFAWVHSQDFKIQWRLIFTQPGAKEIVVPMGSLDFKGWKRVELPVIFPPHNKSQMMSKLAPITLHGIQIVKERTFQTGEYFFYLDQLGLVLDTNLMNYPGSEIKDIWGH